MNIDALMTIDQNAIITDVKQAEALSGSSRDKPIGVPFKLLHRDRSGRGRQSAGARTAQTPSIGLATMRRIIMRLGGRVWVEGAIDHDTFLFRLPPPGRSDGAVQSTAI